MSRKPRTQVIRKLYRKDFLHEQVHQPSLSKIHRFHNTLQYSVVAILRFSLIHTRERTLTARETRIVLVKVRPGSGWSLCYQCTRKLNNFILGFWVNANETSFAIFLSINALGKNQLKYKSKQTTKRNYGSISFLLFQTNAQRYTTLSHRSTTC